MNLKLSMKDINFIRPFFRYLNIFLITPWYDFRRNAIRQPHLMKIHASVLVMLKMAHILYAMLDNTFVELISKFPFTQKILFVALYTIVVTLMLVTIAKACFLDVQAWRRMLMNLQHLDAKLENLGTAEGNILKNFNVQILVNNGLFIAVSLYQSHVWSKLLTMPSWKIYIFTGCVDMYYEVLVVNILTTFLRTFTIRYRELNRRVLKISKQGKFVKELIGTAKNYRLMGETIEMFNKIFGYSMMLILFHCGIQLVHSLHVMCVLVITQDDRLHYGFFAGSVWVLIWLSYICLSIILPVDATLREGRKFIDLLYKMQEEFSETSEEMKALTRIVDYSKNFMKGFKAADFFTVNKGIVFSLVGNVASYVIISIQLETGQKQ